jgi:heat shock protein HslJ
MMKLNRFRVGMALLILVGVLLAACNGTPAPTPLAPVPQNTKPSPPSNPTANPPSTPPVAPGLTGPLWSLVSYRDLQGKTSEMTPSSQVTARFQDGKIAGRDGCNNYNASYTLEGGAIKIETGASTLMACPEPIMNQAQAFQKNLAAVTSFKVDGAKLTLSDASGAGLLTFTRLEPVELQGEWKVQNYSNGKLGMDSVLSGTELKVIFGADGQISGSAGCNTYRAGYSVAGQRIKIDPPAATRKMCTAPEGVMEQEQMFLAALARSQSYGISGNRMVLMTEDKTQLVNLIR